MRCRAFAGLALSWAVFEARRHLLEENAASNTPKQDVCPYHEWQNDERVVQGEAFRESEGPEHATQGDQDYFDIEQP